jgi:uncharacterized membrane protein
MSGWLKVYAVSTVAFFAIDMFWLGVVARGFYRRQLGGLLAEQVNWAAAIVFYLLYIAGIVFFVTLPAARAGSLTRALATGAFFGLVAYATYDLTNQATVRDWPTLVTVVDLAWGALLTAVVAYLTFLVSTRIP